MAERFTIELECGGHGCTTPVETVASDAEAKRRGWRYDGVHGSGYGWLCPTCRGGRRKVSRYLKTLRRIPDDIVLAIAARDFREADPTRCVCGWAVRESMARELNLDAATVDPYDGIGGGVVSKAVTRFGGGPSKWHALFGGALHDTPNVETAFVDRLNEIVRVSPRT